MESLIRLFFVLFVILAGLTTIFYILFRIKKQNENKYYDEHKYCEETTCEETTCK